MFELIVDFIDIGLGGVKKEKSVLLLLDKHFVTIPCVSWVSFSCLCA